MILEVYPLIFLGNEILLDSDHKGLCKRVFSLRPDWGNIQRKALSGQSVYGRLPWKDNWIPWSF